MRNFLLLWVNVILLVVKIFFASRHKLTHIAPQINKAPLKVFREVSQGGEMIWHFGSTVGSFAGSRKALLQHGSMS